MPRTPGKLERFRPEDSIRVDQVRKGVRKEEKQQKPVSPWIGQRCSRLRQWFLPWEKLRKDRCVNVITGA